MWTHGDENRLEIIAEQKLKKIYIRNKYNMWSDLLLYSWKNNIIILVVIWKKWM
jgi:hypothetical protein